MVTSPTVFVIRHGERLDHIQRNWQPDPSQGIWDPPITPQGHLQAEKTGVTLREIMKSYGMDGTKSKVVIYSSPFQRCIDTSIGLIKGMQLGQVTLRLEIGLGEWMCERFFDDICPAALLISQQQQNIARQQAYAYSLRATNSHDDEALPPFSMDYAYNSVQSDFDFPERYTDMLRRFDDTRLHCLDLHTQENDEENNTVIIFVTHAVGVNALLDGFRNRQTRPQESNYCSISCIRPSSSKSVSAFISAAKQQQQQQHQQNHQQQSRSSMDCYSDQSDEDGGSEYVGMNDFASFNNGMIMVGGNGVAGSNAWSIELEVWDRHL